MNATKESIGQIIDKLHIDQTAIPSTERRKVTNFERYIKFATLIYATYTKDSLYFKIK